MEGLQNYYSFFMFHSQKTKKQVLEKRSLDGHEQPTSTAV